MRTIKYDEFVTELKAQGVPRDGAAFVCPACHTVQCAQDLIDAGVGKDFESVWGMVAFSCLGRFTHRLPPPRQGNPTKQIGCNWTLGGLLTIHTLVVIDDEGVISPFFEPATAEQAREHWAAIQKRKTPNGTISA